MHIEEDLHATFGALEREAPEPAETLAGFETLRHRRRVRRRAAGMVVAAVVTGTLASASIAVPNLLDSSDPAPAAKSDGPRLAVEISGSQVAPGQGAAVGTTVRMVGVPEKADGMLVSLYLAGSYDPTAARAGEPIQVNGTSGFFRMDLSCDDCDGKPRVPSVAWEYAPNTWVVLRYVAPSPLADAKAELLRVAEALRFEIQ